jgi:hypothetical protein
MRAEALKGKVLGRAGPLRPVEFPHPLDHTYGSV